MNHWMGEQNQGLVPAVEQGQEGCSHQAPKAPASSPFTTSHLAPVPLPLDWSIQQEQKSGIQCSDCGSPSQSNRDTRQIGKLWHGRGVELRPGSPTLITIGCQGVYDINNSKGIWEGCARWMPGCAQRSPAVRPAAGRPGLGLGGLDAHLAIRICRSPQ